MRTRFAVAFLAAFLAGFVDTAPSVARTAPPADPPALLAALPAGDAIVVVDVPMLLDTTIPAVLAKRPESKAKLDANVARLKADFGLDLHTVRSLALSATVFGMNADWVVAMDGAFEAVVSPDALGKTLEAYVARTPRLSLRRESYEGVTIFVLPDKASGVESSAVAVLDAKTALYGSPTTVRRAIDVRKGKGPTAASNAVLVEALGQAPATAPVRLGVVLDAVVKAQRADDPNDMFLKTLAEVRYVFGSLAATSVGGVALRISARTTKPEHAKAVKDTIDGLVALGRSSLDGKPELAALVDLLTVTVSANDVVLAADVPPEKLDNLFQLVDKNRTVIAGD